MYIDFIDTIRDINNNIYPDIKDLLRRMEELLDQAKEYRNQGKSYAGESLKHAEKSAEFLGKCQLVEVAMKTESKRIIQKMLDQAAEVLNKFEDTEKLFQHSVENAKVWGSEHIDKPVSQWHWDALRREDVLEEVYPKSFSAFHWASKSKSLSEQEKWEAEAAQKTAWSFANEAPNELVKLYEHIGGGKFKFHTKPGLFSSYHWSTQAETSSRHKRWVETQTAEDGQTVFRFAKHVGHADVYVNGIRQTDGSCYSRSLEVLKFNDGLNAGDEVTVSGMEASTGDEYLDIVDEAKEFLNQTQLQKWKAEAVSMTAQSFATEPVNEFVKIYKSLGNGKFETTTTKYRSALHIMKKFDNTMNTLSVVGTFSDLRDLDGNDHQLIQVLGGDFIRDGRGGFFYYDKRYKDINNNGTIIDGWVRDFRGPIDITWFCIDKDGETDITSAMHEVLSLDGDIKIPAGTYMVSDTLEFKNRTIMADGVTFIMSKQQGVAIHISNMDKGHGVYGHMSVIWTNKHNAYQKISYLIEDTQYSTFDLSSENATIGIKLIADKKDTIGNIFNINEMKNNAVGIIINKEDSNKEIKDNEFIDGVFEVEISKEDDDYMKEFGCIYVSSDTASNNTFENNGFIINSSNCPVYVNRGVNNKFVPAFIDAPREEYVFGEDSGTKSILDLTKVNNLNAYIYEDVRAGYISNMNIKNAKQISVYGSASVSTKNKKTTEIISHGVKPINTILNDDGLSTLIYTDGRLKPGFKVSTKNQETSVEVSPSTLSFKDTIKSDKVSMNLGATGIKFLGDGDHMLIDQIGISMVDEDSKTAITKRLVELGYKESLIKLSPDNIFVEDTSMNKHTKIDADGLKVFNDQRDLTLTYQGFRAEDGNEYVDVSNKHIELNTNDSKMTLTTNYLFTGNDTESISVTPQAIRLKDKEGSTYLGYDKLWVKEGEKDLNLSAEKGLEIKKPMGEITLNENRLEIQNEEGFASISKDKIVLSTGGDSMSLEASEPWIVQSRRIIWATDGTPSDKRKKYDVGDLAFERVPVEGGQVGYVCVSGGKPGKWVPFGDIGTQIAKGDKPPSTPIFADLDIVKLYHVADGSFVQVMLDKEIVKTFPNKTSKHFALTERYIEIWPDGQVFEVKNDGTKTHITN